MRTVTTTFLAALGVVLAPENPAIAVAVWESAPAFPSARTDGAAVNQNGTLVVVGGRPFVGEGSAVHYLPPGAPQWQSGAPFGEAIMQPGASVDACGRILVVGGWSLEDHYPYWFPLSNAFTYDVVSGEGDGINAMSVPRGFFAFATDADHRFYLIAGQNSSTDVTNVVERYNALPDPDCDGPDGFWTTLAPLPAPREDATAVYDGQGHILVIGGLNTGGSPRDTVFSYDILGGAWTTIAPQPAALHRQAAVLGADGRVYVVGGYYVSFGSDSDACYIYDPATGVWSVGPNLITPRRDAAVALGDDGYIYAMGGRNGTLGTHLVERLDTNTAPGDFDFDGDVDIDDYNQFALCFTGPGGGPVDPGCEPGDFDGDNDIDCDDWDQFVLAWTRPGDPPELPQCAGAAIPTVSEWGFIAITLLLLSMGIILIRKRGAHTQG